MTSWFFHVLLLVLIWEVRSSEESWGTDVPVRNIRFVTDKEWSNYVDETPRFLAFFYAPWCGHCKAAKPELSEASEKVNIPLVAVDCTSSGSETCEAQNVQAYPKIKYFEGSDVAVEDYGGPRTKNAFVSYVRGKDPNYVATEEDKQDEWGEGNKGDVLLVTDDEFEDYALKTPRFMAFFFAPWCTHCKTTKPEYAAASKEVSIPMIALDCTSWGAKTCRDYEVSGYPTILYFDHEHPDADQHQTYQGGRTKKSFVKFLTKKDPNYEPSQFENVVPDHWPDSTRVIHMTDDHFDEYTTRHPRFLAFFYAPWCGHCKSAKPDYAAAASRFSQRIFRFVAIDCTEDGVEICQKFQIGSFPTFLYFNGGDADPEPAFEGSDRSSGDFITFVWQKLFDAHPVTETSTPEDLQKIPVKVLQEHLRKRGANCKGFVDKMQLISKVLEVVKKQPKIEAPGKSKRRKKSLMQEKREEKANAVAAVGWSEETHGNGQVVHTYTDDTIESHIRATNGKGSLVFFFAPWCVHCKDQKTGYVEASEKIAEIFEEREIETSVSPFAAVDCDQAIHVCQKYGITSYPKYRWIEEPGSHGTDFPGGRSMEGFTTFVAEKFGESWKPPPNFEAYMDSQPKYTRVHKRVGYGVNDNGEFETWDEDPDTGDEIPGTRSVGGNDNAELRGMRAIGSDEPPADELPGHGEL